MITSSRVRPRSWWRSGTAGRGPSSRSGAIRRATWPCFPWTRRASSRPTGATPRRWISATGVLAIGQPFGLSGTVTAGIVSGKGRGIGIALYEDLIQTDAAINPGNSGGPLVNLRGEIVGINTAIKTLGGGYEGVGFAVPASRARRVAADLAEFGRVRRAYLGVTIRPVDPPTAERLGSTGAAMITSVAAASPAAAVGLQPGDVILQVDGKPVDGPGPAPVDHRGRQGRRADQPDFLPERGSTGNPDPAGIPARTVQPAARWPAAGDQHQRAGRPDQRPGPEHQHWPPESRPRRGRTTPQSGPAAARRQFRRHPTQAR